MNRPNRSLLGAALCAASLACLALLPRPARAAEAYREVGVGEVELMLGAKDVRIFDVNSAELYAKYHLPSAVRVEKGIDSLLPADKSTRLVFYCANTL